MKIDLLREIASAVFDELLADGLRSECHYFFDEKWFAIDGTTAPLPPDVALALNKSKGEEIAYHAPKSRVAWFYFLDIHATISVEFPSSPKIATRQQIRQKIEGIRKNALNAFKVAHNELTGLLSRDAFRERLKTAIDEIDRGQPKGFVVASEGQPLATVSVLAFDIDKFKQVNDTYGHIYGDQVLKAFAWRLEETAETLKKEFGSNIRVSLGHPSGEEFLALVEGPLANEDLAEIAEKFRVCIVEDPLPSDSEWRQLSAGAELERVRLPQKNERSISTSVGVTSYTGANPSDKSAPLVLLDKADIALYRSKSGGRNRVTQFDDILQRCGRVLEHDTVTGVVAVDIGNKVGVLVGQEFRVFPPTYFGQTAYTVDDGRSRKTLGVYPKIELCRIVIFNSQNDISFGHLASPSSLGKVIPPGSQLEAVPLGSFAHLIDRPAVLGNVLGAEQEPQPVSGGSELQEYIEQLVRNEKHPFAAVFRFKLESDYYKKYGSAAVNRALAQLFSTLRSKFPIPQRVGIIDTTAICVVGDATAFDESELSTILAEAYPQNDELEPICGYYSDLNSTNNSDKHNAPVELDRHAIELARYALSNIDGFKEKRIQAFSTPVAESILQQHRKLRSFASGVTDYLRLKEIGVRSAGIENVGGLCYSGMKEYSLAFDCYIRATELNPDNIIYRGNVAILATRTNQIDAGLSVASKIKTEKLESLRKVHPSAFWAYAVLLAKAKRSESPLFDSDRMRLIGPLACDMEDAHEKPEFHMVRSALDGLIKGP